MSIDLEREVEEVQLTFAFRELKMDDLLVLACGIARYATVEQMPEPVRKELLKREAMINENL